MTRKLQSIIYFREYIVTPGKACGCFWATWTEGARELDVRTGEKICLLSDYKCALFQRRVHHLIKSRDSPALVLLDTVPSKPILIPSCGFFDPCLHTANNIL
jgi:hypothetical protein